MSKTNYRQLKRQKEIARKNKQQAKQQRRAGSQDPEPQQQGSPAEAAINESSTGSGEMS